MNRKKPVSRKPPAPRKKAAHAASPRAVGRGVARASGAVIQLPPMEVTAELRDRLDARVAKLRKSDPLGHWTRSSLVRYLLNLGLASPKTLALVEDRAGAAKRQVEQLKGELAALKAGAADACAVEPAAAAPPALDAPADAPDEVDAPDGSNAPDGSSATAVPDALDANSAA